MRLAIPLFIKLGGFVQWSNGRPEDILDARKLASPLPVDHRSVQDKLGLAVTADINLANLPLGLVMQHPNGLALFQLMVSPRWAHQKMLPWATLPGAYMWEWREVKPYYAQRPNKLEYHAVSRLFIKPTQTIRTTF